MTIYAYKRCSTNEDKQDVTRQLYGKTFDQIVVEYASGKDEKGRPLFQELKSKLISGDELYFNDLSRAGRNTKELLSTVEDLVERGVKVVFHTESLVFVNDEQDPMAGAMSKMLLTMLASVNELFLTQTKIAVKQGLNRVKRETPEKLSKGKDSQWRKTYDKNKAAGLHRNKSVHTQAEAAREPTAAAIRDMINYSNDSLTQRDICSKLSEKGILTPQGKEWTPAGISRLIKREGISYKRKTNL